MGYYCESKILSSWAKPGNYTVVEKRSRKKKTRYCRDFKDYLDFCLDNGIKIEQQA